MTLQEEESSKTEGPAMWLQGLHMNPTLSGETEFVAHVPEVYIPTIPEVTSAHETEVVRQMSFLNETNLK